MANPTPHVSEQYLFHMVAQHIIDFIYYHGNLISVARY